MICAALGLLAIATSVIEGKVTQLEFGLEGRFAGGSDISITEAPYQVSVQLQHVHFGSGSIISKRVVLSTAHIFIHPKLEKQFSIQYGYSRIGGTSDEDSFLNIISCKEILFKSDNSRSHNDIALMILESDIVFSSLAQPIPIASIAPAVGTNANVAGWLISEKIFTLVGHGFKKNSVQILDRYVCQSTIIAENMLCTSASEDRISDAGTPLVSNGELDGSLWLGKGCGKDDCNGIYISIAANKEWIELNIKRYEII